MSGRSYKAPRGTFDILPDDSPSWRRLESSAAEVFRRFGYREIRTPMLEEEALFVRSIGEATDIVEKEMYVFDGGSERLALRPEATAPVVRAYLQAGFQKSAPFQKLAYLGPMFRYERPQAGRFRQFHQLGVEAIGSYAPSLDAEVIAVALAVLDALEISGYEVQINSLGCADCRPAYRDLLVADLAGRLDSLCDNCRRRSATNPLRVLDCKREGCRTALEGIPSVIDHLCEGCATHHGGFKEALDLCKIAYVETPALVRGFDYYTKTVFEVVHGSLGAQSAVAAGGRYDGLVEELGGPPTGAVGFASGIDRMLMLAEATVVAGRDLDAYVVTCGGVPANEGLRLVMELRAAGVACDCDHDGRSAKAQMRAADRCGARFTALLGPDELAAGSVTMKEMSTGEEATVARADLPGKLKEGV